MSAHSMFHEKKGLPISEKTHLILLHIAESETEEFFQIKQDLKEALTKAGINVNLETFAEKIEQTMVNKEHDIQFRVKTAVLLDEFTRLLAAKGLETKGIAKLTWDEIHEFFREKTLPYEKRATMTLAALISLEGIV